MSTKLRDLDDELGAAFRSADRDGPRPAAKAALMTALGVGVVAAASTAAAAGGGAGAAAAGAAAASAAGGSTAAAAKGAGLAVIAKWFIASAVIVGGAAATVHAVAPATEAATPAATERVRPLAPQRTTSVTPAEAPTTLPTDELPVEAPLPVITPEALLSAPAPAPVVVVAPRPSAASTTTESGPTAEPAPRRATVADEILALDGARSLLARGNGAGALDALRDYRRAFPAGVLAQEASVLEIESLAGAGQRDRARTLGDLFVAEHPQSPLVPRVVRAAGK